MAENRNKEKSTLVHSVQNLDQHSQNLERIGSQIASLEMRSEFDFEHAERLMLRFAEAGEGLSNEVEILATELQEVRLKAEAVSQLVASRVEQLKQRKIAIHEKREKFGQLTGKVQDLNSAIARLRPSEGSIPSETERTLMLKSLSEFEGQFESLIQEARSLRAEAHEFKLKSLEQNADALAQTLQSAKSKIVSLTPSAPH